MGFAGFFCVGQPDVISNRGVDSFVSHEGLNFTERAVIKDKVRCEAVTKDMRSDFFVYASN